MSTPDPIPISIPISSPSPHRAAESGMASLLQIRNLESPHSAAITIRYLQSAVSGPEPARFHYGNFGSSWTFFVSVFFPHGLKLPLPGPYIEPRLPRSFPGLFFSSSTSLSLSLFFFLTLFLFLLYTLGLGDLATWLSTWESNLLPIMGRPSSLPPLNPIPPFRSP